MSELLTPAQVTAARELLGWSTTRFASKIGISYGTLITFEKTGIVRWAFNNQRARDVFEAAGVEFSTAGGAEGVRLRNGVP